MAYFTYGENKCKHVSLNDKLKLIRHEYRGARSSTPSSKKYNKIS
jgi:hypothetical protein